MKYTKLLLVAYNGDCGSIREIPEDCFHVTADLADAELLTESQMMREFIAPMFRTVFARLIPDMPKLGDDGYGNPSAEGMRRLLLWEQRYYGGIHPTHVGDKVSNGRS